MKIFKKKTRGAGRSLPFAKIKGSKGFISGIVLVLVIAATVHSISMGAELRDKDSQISELKKEKQEEEQRTEEIEKYKEYVGTDEYIEDVARDKLGMVKENEILFKSAD